MNQEQWLQERKKGIGGSDAAAVLNEGYGCRLRLWFDKTGQQRDYRMSPDQELICRRGTILEELVADEWAGMTGQKIRRMPARVSKDHPHLRVNVDRQIVNDPRGPGALECKTAASYVYFDMLENGMPSHYVCQIQHAFIVTGYTWGEFAVREPASWQPLNVPVKPSPEFAAMYIPKAAEFWQMVQERERPEPLLWGDDRCYQCEYRKTCLGERAEREYVAAKQREFTTEEVDEVLFPILQARKATEAERDEAQAKLDAVNELLRKQMGDRGVVIVPSIGQKVIFKTQSSMRWDTAALDAEQPHLAAKYKRPGTPTRPLKVNDWTPPKPKKDKAVRA